MAAARRSTAACVFPERARSDLQIERELRALAPLALAPLAVLELRRLGADLVERGDARGDEHVAADHRAAPDGRVAAEDRRTGVDRHVVLDRRVALLPAQELPERGRQRPQR